MAEVAVDDSSVVATGKSGRHSRFTTTQELFIVPEVAAANAHTPKYGETKRRFEQVAAKVNSNPAFNDDPVTWNAAQDRYKRLQEQYCENDNANQRLSSINGGETGELADLLITMREAEDDWESQKRAVKSNERRKEEDKERMGQELVDAANKRKASSGSVEEEGDASDGSYCTLAAKHKKQRVSTQSGGEELDAFGTHLKEADLARIDLEKDRLEFEREHAAADRAEREEERKERRLEREDERRERREERIEQQKLELEKFKAMIEAFNSNK